MRELSYGIDLQGRLALLHILYLRIAFPHTGEPKESEMYTGTLKSFLLSWLRCVAGEGPACTLRHTYLPVQ